MLLMNGNTATYMQYSYARVLQHLSQGGSRSRLRFAQSGAKIVLTHPAERALGCNSCGSPRPWPSADADYMPHHLTAYLFDLAKSYSAFFENCPVLKAEDEATRNSRLLLCDLTARTIRLGLDLLGIKVVEKM